MVDLSTAWQDIIGKEMRLREKDSILPFGMIVRVIRANQYSIFYEELSTGTGNRQWLPFENILELIPLHQ